MSSRTTRASTARYSSRDTPGPYQPGMKRKRADYNDDDEDVQSPMNAETRSNETLSELNSEDEPVKAVPAAKKRRFRRKLGDVCNFCKFHPRGIQMHANSPCKIKNAGGNYEVECQNCSDYRFEREQEAHNAFTTAFDDSVAAGLELDELAFRHGEGSVPSHVLQKTTEVQEKKFAAERAMDAAKKDMDEACNCRCTMGKSKRALEKGYSKHHPRFFPDFACEGCKEKGLEKRCDADPFLRLRCSRCPSKTRNREACPCIVVMGNLSYNLDEKPNLRQNFKKWFRHECDVCKNRGKKKGAPGCSWLTDRLGWDKPCTRCSESDMFCLDGGFVLDGQDVTKVKNPPTKWSNTHMLNDGWIESRGGTPYRKGCRACVTGGNHCRPLAQQIAFSCSKCFQWGIPCDSSDKSNETWPVYDFSRIGIGNLCPFRRCNSCKENNRNCDRQRPCDSCVEQDGIGCDCDDLKDSMGCMERSDTRPGAIYYLALGYGANGVNDVKDGTKMEHYIGPLFPFYGIDEPRKFRPVTKAVAATSTSARTTRASSTIVVAAEEPGSDDGDKEDDEDREDDEESVTAKSGNPSRNKSVSNMVLTAIAEAGRNKVRPKGAPPLADDEELRGRQLWDLTAEDLARVIERKWGSGTPYPPKLHKHYKEAIKEAKESLRDGPRRKPLRTGTTRAKKRRPAANKPGQRQQRAIAPAPPSFDPSRTLRHHSPSVLPRLTTQEPTPLLPGTLAPFNFSQPGAVSTHAQTSRAQTDWTAANQSVTPYNPSFHGGTHDQHPYAFPDDGDPQAQLLPDWQQTTTAIAQSTGQDAAADDFGYGHGSSYGNPGADSVAPYGPLYNQSTGAVQSSGFPFIPTVVSNPSFGSQGLASTMPGLEDLGIFLMENNIRPLQLLEYFRNCDLGRLQGILYARNNQQQRPGHGSDPTGMGF